MYVNLNWIERNFAIMNDRFFNSCLPTPVFVVNHSDSYLGQCSYSYKRSIFGRHTGPISYAIRISNRYSRNEGDFLNTLLHEMIHLYFYSIGKLNVGHGKEFQEMGRSFDKYGFNIQTRSDLCSNIHPRLSRNTALNNVADVAINWFVRLSLLFVGGIFICNKDAMKVLCFMLKIGIDEGIGYVQRLWIEYDMTNQLTTLLDSYF